MGTLDNESLVQSLDSENMLQSIQDLPDQVNAAWDRVQSFTLPTHYIQAESVVILGLGASAVSGLIAQAIGQRTSRLPIQVVDSGELPEYVNTSTLVIAVSYTGKTSEVAIPFALAGQRGAKLVGISTGGEVGAICRKYRSPHFAIQYGAYSRAAIGYLVVPVVALLQRLGIIELDHIDQVMRTLVSALRVASDKYRPQVPTAQNRAKQVAEVVLGRLPVLLGSEWSIPVVRRWQMQLQQNAQVFAVTDTLPGALHTSVDGVSFPANLADQLSFLSIRSQFDLEAVASAQNIYGALLKRHRFQVEDIVLQATSDPLAEFFELILLGDYVSYYLSLLNGVDPSTTPNMMEVERLQASALNA